jgi:hypothetical protein
MNLSTEPHKRRDGIHVPDDFAAQLAERATRAAVAATQRRTRMRRLTWTATAVAAVFAGVLISVRPHTAPAASPVTELSVDEAWSALEQGAVTLTEDELLELAELHGITSL